MISDTEMEELREGRDKIVCGVDVNKSPKDHPVVMTRLAKIRQ